MKIIDEITDQEITNPDLENGELHFAIWARPEAYASIDGVEKFALDDSDYEEVQIYHVWTAEEIAEREQAEAEATEQERREEFLSELPEVLADSDNAICELYETMLSQADTIAEQDNAICELYELVIGGAE